jgi:hypothetical protein
MLQSFLNDCGSKYAMVFVPLLILKHSENRGTTTSTGSIHKNSYNNLTILFKAEVQ